MTKKISHLESTAKFIKSLFSLPKSRKIVFLGYGNNLIIPVYGEHFGQSHKQTALSNLYKEYGEKVIDFSLAPQSVYQESMGWPEKPFLNVLPVGNYRVTQDNWLGYISPLDPDIKDSEHKDRLKYTKKLIELGEQVPLVVKGKIIKENGEYCVILFASHKEIDQELEKLS